MRDSLPRRGRSGRASGGAAVPGEPGAGGVHHGLEAQTAPPLQYLLVNTYLWNAPQL